MQQANSTLYDYLQVSQHASDGVIRAAYKNLAQQWHPDRHSSNRDHAELMMLRINQAYQVLSDDEMRRKYDDFLQQNHESHTRPEKYPARAVSITGRTFVTDDTEALLSSPGRIISVIV